MRVIGHLETDKDAQTFGDYLYVQGIHSEAERDDQRWAIWVHSDDDISRATKLLEEYRANPNDPRFQEGSPAAKLREQQKAEDAAYQKRVVSGRALFPGLRGFGFGPVTYALIVISVVVFFVSKMGKDYERLAPLFITKITVEDGYMRWIRGLHEVRQGEVWRLLSPIFIHFGPTHILFNMLWIKDLGSLFEARLRSWYFALFVVVIGIASNFGEYLMTHRPNFGGMSGVVYGLIGYVWIRGRLDPGAGIMMDRQSVILSLVWFVACFSGFVGPIANWAHAVGLIGGMLWAFIDSKRRTA